MDAINDIDGIEIRTVGDSRGYLWKIIIDKARGIGRIEKISGLDDSCQQKVDGAMYELAPNSQVSDDMQHLTTKIESRFKAA